MSQKDQRLLVPENGYDNDVGVWLSALQDARARTLRVLEHIEPEWFGFMPENDGESIGTILYHLAAIEASWLYEEVLQVPFPPEIETLFPYDVRDEHGKLTSVSESVQEHLKRLEMVRDCLLHEFLSMTADDFREVRSLPEYDISPMYVIHHLMQHEAEHRSQIDAIGMKARMVIGRKTPQEKS